MIGTVLWWVTAYILIVVPLAIVVGKVLKERAQ